MSSQIPHKIKRTKVKLIDVNTLFPGMYIKSALYIRIKNSFVLLCTDVLLTPNLIRKLRNAAEQGNFIYITEDYYENILDQSRRFFQLQKEGCPVKYHLDSDSDFEEMDIQTLKRKLKKVKEYKALTKETNSMLSGLTKELIVKEDVANQVVGTISSELKNTDTAIIMQCINNIREVDNYLYTHSTNVAILNGLIGSWMELPKKEIDMLIKIGLLHDLGKLKVPPEILNKPARLTQEEFEIIKKHPVDSYQILIDSGITDEIILKGVRSHHERMNGTGYPDGLRAYDIPLYARITAVSDVYDAMVAKRPYKNGNSPFEILAEFAASRFSDLDLKIVNVFLQKMPTEYLHKKALLSDGRVAQVMSINASDYAYPIVLVDGHLLKTNNYIKCIAIDDFISVFPNHTTE